METQKGIDVAQHSEWWLSPEGDIFLAIPNGDLTFFTMSIFDDKGSIVKMMPNAYPLFVWERLGWERLGKYLE